MAYSYDVIQAVWKTARAMPHKDPARWRKDQCGAWIHFDQYDNEESEYGWKIARVQPGPGTAIKNLRPLHRDNHFDIASGTVHCRVSADRTGLAPEQTVTEPRNRNV